MHIILWLIGGIVAGWLAGLLVRGHGFGVIGDLVIGLIGGIVGGFLGGLLGIVPVNWLGNVLVAALGGVVLVVVVRAIRRV
jgi:uncharacterized membrane protein YeaQ/YmgE (transglycosylase-associated protein family)